MSEPTIRVLHITEMLSAAGIESFIMNMYRHIDRSKVQFDFMVLRNQKEFYDDEIEKLGGRKYYVHSNISNTWLRILDEANQIERFLKHHHYDIVHIHYTTPLRAPYLRAAKKAGVGTRIYHAHSAAVSGKSKLKMAIYKYYRSRITKWGTEWFACSKAAAEWIYPENFIGKVKVIYNGIDIDRFRYDTNRRNSTRKSLGIQDEFILIHTGRFIDQKNQSFVLDIFYELKKKCKTAKLIFLGDGCQLQNIKEKANRLKLSDDIRFLGVKGNVEDFLCAADCYVMPSLYEGLPVAAVEAECSGLPTVLSDNITREVQLIDNVSFVSLKESVGVWCDQVLRYRNESRKDEGENVMKGGYDVKDVAKKLQNYYENVICG